MTLEERPALTPQQWREDLRFLLTTLVQGHPNPYHATSREALEAAVADLDSRIPTLERHEILVGMAAILASVGDGHTSMFLPWNDTLGFGSYPLRLYHFGDGLRVSSAAPEHHGLIGARVLRIGETAAEEALRLAGTAVSRDNDMGLKLAAPDCLTVPEICHALGLVPDVEMAEFTLEHGGREVSVRLRPTSETLPRLGPVPGAATPLWLRRPEAPFWFEFLPERETLYVQYNAVCDGQDETTAGFFARVFHFVDDNPVERFVLDLRHNGGGNMDLNLPLVHGLIRSDKVNRPGRLFALIGRQTFSAAMNCAADLERHTHALFAGEPTGSSPNFYGETNWTLLPHSGAGWSFSSLYWQCSHPGDHRPWIEPHLPVALSSADYLSGRDPVLEAVLTRP